MVISCAAPTLIVSLMPMGVEYLRQKRRNAETQGEPDSRKLKVESKKS